VGKRKMDESRRKEGEEGRTDKVGMGCCTIIHDPFGPCLFGSCFFPEPSLHTPEPFFMMDGCACVCVQGKRGENQTIFFLCEIF